MPCLHVSGWYDSFIPQTIAAYEALSAAGRAEHRLIVGPWYHIPWTQQVGEIDFGDEAKNTISVYERAWFDAWLKDDRAGWRRCLPSASSSPGRTAGTTPTPGRSPAQAASAGICTAQAAPTR